MVRMNPAARDLFGLPPGAGAGGRLFDCLAPASRETLGRLVDRIDALPRDKRFLWVPGGLDGSGADGKPFAAEATLSRFEMEGRRYLTLILRDVNDRVEAERQISRLRRETEYLREEIRSLDDSGAIVGKSRALQSVLDSAAQVAGTDTTVLIQGETGTGKELVARFVHRRSRRARGAFVKLNCAALQPTLVESEFFGHEAGAFTGATQKRKGRFELADGGTLFLDEVSEIPMEVQAKLLRVLQEGQFERVGASRSLTVDVRVVAATNRKLNKAMVEGTFRADLFYRLNVYPIQIPPLRERREDIPVLVHHFVSRIASKMGKNIRTIPADAMNALTVYDWPGNVRELKNVLERAVITSTGPALRIGDTLEAPPVPIRSAKGAARFATLAAMERCYIAKVLSSTGWRISGPKGAAAVLGLNPSTLRYRIQKLKIRKPWATGAGPNPPLGGGEGRSPNVAHR
jgi:transcriptional regulator with GAF, ATPase, and Fis domain